MLRNRSRAVASKQALMSDQPSSLSPTTNSCSPISSFLNSPRFFNGFPFLSKKVFDAETMSPTSILDSRTSTNFLNPFGCDRAPSAPATEAIGLAIIDSIIGESDDCKFSRSINRAALFGSKLKVKIPELSSTASPVESSPKSPADFGIKTRSSQLLSPFGSSPAKDFARQLSLKEMEMSEDYTCVITHGPNPKTTHIYDDCIVESCSLDDDDNVNKRGSGFEGMEDEIEMESTNFLSFCHACKALLGQDKDIYMYRGEKAFCSQECRCQEMIFEGMESRRLDDVF